jgi:hypothetical protein
MGWVQIQWTDDQAQTVNRRDENHLKAKREGNRILDKENQ